MAPGMGIVTQVFRTIGSLIHSSFTEALKFKKYSEKTDSYSFGVLLWEVRGFISFPICLKHNLQQMVTREEPYGNEPLLHIAMQVASEGRRLEIPADCPEVFASLMKRCWAEAPEDRPSMKQIYATLSSYHESFNQHRH